MLTAEGLRDVLVYDEQTGIFVWRRKSVGRAKTGAEAGTLHSNGARYICIDGKQYQAHRLAWFYAYGEWPCGFIDHSNRNRADNRLSNLREATPQQNNANSVARRDNLSGLKGVRKRRRKWQAYLTHNRRQKSLGFYSTPEEAHAAYSREARLLYGEYARAS